MNDRSPLPTIVLAAFLAGLLDIVAAIIVYSIFLDKTTALAILQSVASGVFGRAAYEGGMKMAAYGLALHFIITIIFTSFYFFVYPRLELLRKERIFSGIIYGIFVWLVMNLIVLPIALSGVFPASIASSLIGIAIVIIAVGIPTSLIAHFYFRRKSAY